MREFLKKTKYRYLICNYILMCIMAQLSPMVVIASNTTNAGVEAINNSFGIFYDIIASFISSIGSVFVLWGIFEFGTFVQPTNGTGQAMFFRRVGGGLVMCLGPALVKGLLVV